MVRLKRRDRNMAERQHIAYAVADLGIARGILRRMRQHVGKILECAAGDGDNVVVRARP